MKKGFQSTLFLFFLFLTVFLTGCLPLKKTTEKLASESTKTETTISSDWQSYENQQQKFSFQHPSDWQLEVVNDQVKFFSASLKKEDLSQEKIVVYEEEMTPFYQISIVVRENPKSFSAKEVYLNNFSISSREKAAEGIEMVTVADLTGIKYVEGVGGGSGPGIAVSVAANNKVYTFTYMATATKETHEKFLSEFDQILTSVKLE